MAVIMNKIEKTIDEKIEDARAELNHLEAMKELVILRARVEKLEKALSLFAKIGGFMTRIPATRDVRLGFLAVEGDGINSHGSATMLVADFLSARAALAADGETNDSD